ncbi:MAG TPA: DUF899 domain-containing protein [Pseudonocardia sp.]|jgi:predicted dithiol-disulfide oxidoreductase (DUF899 family)|uniref:DUF899 domain-containing protein n=1 Tax=Pseudonocardia sp. TaxID=60912 RepID=UPI002C6B2103|nr:DUF899 domain-containing protein [Pseudonocardia sp.]HTF48306.1 DUF899 domain-containing protein [Pseudonocardia sp.]
MDAPEIVTREEWLSARLALLAQEKEASRVTEDVNVARRALPMVEIDKEYVFEGPAGPARLIDLFEGRRQLIIYHFMWRFDSDQGCPSCSMVADNIGHLAHLHNCDTSLALVSRAPLTSIEKFKSRMGWTVPWYSSHGSDFNYDFHVTNDEAVAPIEYNYKDKAALEREGLDFYAQPGQDGQGASVFLCEGDRVFHTYSSSGRGMDSLVGTYRYLDMTPLGRQKYINEFTYHDQYGVSEGHYH